MTRLLYDLLTSTLQPYPRADDEPVVGLEPRYLEMDVLQQPEPAYDPATQQLQPTEAIDTAARTVTRGWTVVELPPSVPSPDWGRFKAAILSNTAINAALAQALPLAPAAATALAPTLLRAEQGLIDDFATAWAAVLAVAPVAPQVLTDLVSLATACHLPAAFVAALTPAAT